MTRPLAALAAVVLLSAPAAAQLVTWAGPAAGGSWSVAANWSSSPALPGANDVAVFGGIINTAATVDLDGTRTVRAVRVSGATGPVTITAGSLATSVLTLRGGSGGGDLLADTADLTVEPTVAVGDAATPFADVVMIAGSGRTLTIGGLDLSGANGALRQARVVSGATGTVRLGAGGVTATGDGSAVQTTLAIQSDSRLLMAADQTWRPTGTVIGVSPGGGGDLDFGPAGAGRTLTIAPAAAGGRGGGAFFSARLVGTGNLTLAPASAAPDAGLVVIQPQNSGASVANTASGTLTVAGGTLQLAGQTSWGGTTVNVTGGQLLPGFFDNGSPSPNPPTITNPLPVTTVLSLTGSGAYNLGQPDLLTGAVPDTPRPHVQTYAGVTLNGTGRFNTGSANNGFSGITVTGTFAHPGTGELRVNGGGVLTANRLDMPAGGGAVVVEGPLAGGGFSGRLTVGAGGLAITDRAVTLTPPAAGTVGGLLDLAGPVAAAGTTRFGGAAGVAGAVGLSDPAVPVTVTSGTLTVAATRIQGNTNNPAGVVKRGAGELVLAGPNLINFGTTRLEAGRLVLADAAALGTVSASPGSGGRLTLAGGAVSTAGGAGGAGVSVQAGSLLFDGPAGPAPPPATLELGSGPHVLRFAQFDGGAPVTLTVTGWQGPGSSPGTAGRIVFDNPGSLPSYLSQITFTGYEPGAVLIPFAGGGLELVPVPEPAAMLLAAVAGLAAVRAARRRILA
jgi:hypothetical protein